MKSVPLFILLIITTIMSAQPLKNHVDFPELGVSFDIPSGWTGQQMEGFIIMGHQTIPGLIIVSDNKSQSSTELKNLAEQGIYDQGVSLQAASAFEIKEENRVEGMYQGIFDGAQVKCYAIGLINGLGSGMNILILTTPELFSEQHKQVANKLASSVKFFQAKETNQTTEWKKYLVGRRLTYMSTSGGSDYSGGYSGTSTKEHIDLCSNGQFYYYYNSHSSFNAGDGAGDLAGFGYADAKDDNMGQYRIYSVGNTTYLELTFQNGNVSEYVVSTNSDQHTLLNGTRYFVVDNERCN